MGRMVEGHWTTEWYKPDEKGRFVRGETKFRGRIEAAGKHPPASGRYHLYVSYACPWAHRTLILRAFKGLESAISVTVVDPEMGDDGWVFSDRPECGPDPILGVSYLREVYAAADPKYTGRVTVPILWDKEERTIVNNESREIIRMLDHDFSGIAMRDVDYCPPQLQEQVDNAIRSIYTPINNGVYRSGFAVTQEAYEEAVNQLFEALDHWEGVLSGQPFLCGDVVTEADVCMFATLYRFDPVYYGHFKCNRRRIVEYPSLWRFVRRIYQMPGVAQTCHLDHIKRHYYWSHPTINPTRIVPVGPEIDYDAPLEGLA